MVVLIDDDSSVLLALEVMCDELNLKSFKFLSGVEALSFIQSKKEREVSLVICDYKMPEMNGLEIISKIHSTYENLPTILITAHDSSDIAIKSLEVGAYDYITKPINFKELSILSQRAIRQKKIKDENIQLVEKIKEIENPHFDFIGKSKSIEDIKQVIKKVANTSASVLITGETGTGKEIIAKSLHSLSDIASKEMVTINCASIPEHLLESELFGHKKGSFTGADKDKKGLFEEADNGVLFLDEIGDMSIGLQAKLLRVLQEGKIRRVGETKERTVKVRILAATHCNLIEKIKEKKFREDLYFRLSVISISLPSLRERKEDIPLLVEYFLKKYKKSGKSNIKSISKSALSKLMTYDWPGNIRELENTVERACILTTDTELDDESVSINTINSGTNFNKGLFQDLKSLREIEEEYIRFVLTQTENVKDKAAAILKINRKTLYRKIKEYNIE